MTFERTPLSFPRVRDLLELRSSDFWWPGLMSLGATTLRLVALFSLMPLVNLVLGNGLGRLERIPGLSNLVPADSSTQRLQFVFFAIVLTATLLQGVLARVSEVRAVTAGQRAERAVARRVFEQLFAVEHAGRISPPDIDARLLSKLPSKAQRLPMMARRAITSTGSFLLFTLALILLSWKLAVAASLVLVVFFLVFSKVSRRIEMLEEQLETDEDTASTRVQEVAENRPLVLLSGTAGQERERFLDGLIARQKSSLSLERMTRSLASSKDIASILVILAFVMLLPILEDAPQAGVGKLLVVVLVLRRLMAAFGQVLQVPVLFQKANFHLGAIEEALADGKSGSHVHPGTTSGQTLDGPLEGIELCELSFHYPNSDRAGEVLSAIDLRCEPGMTFLVGANGSGKSTLLKLIAGLHQPSSGRVLINGSDLAGFNPSDWFSRLTYTTSEPWFFEGSALFNATYGLELDTAVARVQQMDTAVARVQQMDTAEARVQQLDAAEARVQQMDTAVARVQQLAHELGLDQWIASQPNGWHTEIGDGGHRMSDGEQQRLALLRALIRDPDLLLFDEAFSAIDEPGLKHCMSELRRLVSAPDPLRTQRMALIATHRLGIVRPQDQVLVLADGRLVQAGARADIETPGSEFSRLVTGASDR